MKAPAQLTQAANDALNRIDSLPDKQAIAKHFGVSVRTVDRWIAEKRIPYIKFGRRCIRFRWGDVERAINRLVVQEVK
jgi:excisionase family DNA binding protein